MEYGALRPDGYMPRLMDPCPDRQIAEHFNNAALVGFAQPWLMRCCTQANDRCHTIT